MIEAKDKEKIFRANTANIIRKVKAGKPLTKAELATVGAEPEKAPAEVAAETIHANKLCQWTGLTDSRHRQLAKLGYYPDPVESRYQLEATVAGMFRHFREQKSKTKSSDERIKKARAEKLELANEAAKRGSIPAEEVRREVTRAFQELKGQLLIIPRRMGQVLALETDAVTVEEKINAELVSVLEARSVAELAKGKE